MADPQPSHDFSLYHDQLFNHMLGVNIYTPLCIFFRLSEETNKEEVIKTLRKGIDVISENFPWMTGQVVKNKHTGNEAQSLRLVPSDGKCRLIISDLNDEASMPSMTDFEQTWFPAHMIDGEKFTPLTGIPNGRPEDICPAFFLQATFIKEGLVLAFAGEHSTMDGQATGQAVRLFHKACCGESFSHEELLEGNRTRGITVPLLGTDTYRPGPELDYLVRKTSNQIDSNVGDVVPVKCRWAYVHFSASSLIELKRQACFVNEISDQPTSIIPTTNDAMTAFIWQSIVRARAPRLGKDATSTLGRAVDVRSALSFSNLYLGNMSNHTYTTLVCNSLLSTSLHSISASLRAALNPESVAYGVRSLATYLATTQDKTRVHYGANMDFSRDIFISSWARLPCYEHDFNLGLGQPLSVRRPGFLEIEGLNYLLPMDNDGGITAMLCLREDDLDNLKRDTEFGKHSTWID